MSEEPARPGPSSPAAFEERLSKPSFWSLQRGAKLFKESVGEKASADFGQRRFINCLGSRWQPQLALSIPTPNHWEF